MVIGVVGLGDMGKRLAVLWADLGFTVYGSDLPQNLPLLRKELDSKKIKILTNKEVASKSDVLIFSVETENIGSVVKELASEIKKGAIVTGQTSVKTPEISAFERYLDKSVAIVGSHALFGPAVDPKRQVVAIFRHRATEDQVEQIAHLFRVLDTDVQYLENYQTHDRMMADIQVVTHIGFESIGTAFMHRKSYPWKQENSITGLDHIKLLMTLRIYSYKPHVYAGLAFHNPYAAADVRCFALSEQDLFGQMISENLKKFKSKIMTAREKVFKNREPHRMLISDEILSLYALDTNFPHLPNSHLSLLSMVCTWATLGTDPYSNLVCQTPPFKLRVGLAEYLFLNEGLLEETIQTAVFDKSIRQDDLAFHTAVHEWSNIVELGDKAAYTKHFEATANFLGDKKNKGREESEKLIELLK